MPASNLIERVSDLVVTQLPSLPAEVHPALEELLTRLREPVRIAVVGRVSAGKSTMVNALLGQCVAPTNVSECTRLVTWFRYGHPQRVEIELLDGSRTETQLGPDGRLPNEVGVPPSRVRALHCYLANELLRWMTLIDTPGIGSVHAEYSASTEELLAAERASSAAARRADAVIFLFNQVVMEDELKALQLFRTANSEESSQSAANAVGVLAKADQLGDGSRDPWGVALELAGQYAGKFRDEVATVVPVIGLIAESAEAALLTEPDVRHLGALAAMEPKAFERLLWSADRFASADAPVAAEERQRLLELLDLYGVRLAVTRIRDGASDAVPLRRELAASSGIAEVKQTLAKYFREQDHLLKVRSVLEELRRISYAPTLDATSSAGFRAALESLRLDPEMQPICELEALHDCCSGRVELPGPMLDEVTRLFAPGTVANRLGIASSDRSTLAEATRRRHDTLAHLHGHRGGAGAAAGGARRVAHVPGLVEGLAMTETVPMPAPASTSQPTGAAPGVQPTVPAPADESGQAAGVSDEVGAVTALVRRVAEVIRSEGRADTADGLLRRSQARQKPRPVVLVAGEDKRGKSSLVNALLRRTELSPIGVEVVTGAPISFFYAEPERASIVHYGQQSPVPTDLETARKLATVQGNPENEENIRAVQIGISAPLLEKVTLVDTPGVGGLSSGHGELTLQSLQFADALVFVVEAGAQFRAAELEFLRRAAARIDTVVLALTKIDLYRGWRQILQDNLAILAEKAPRFARAPVVPVSSLLAARALACDDEEERLLLLEESGIPRLEDELGERVVGRAAVLGQVNVLRESLWPLGVADRAVGEQLAALSSDGASRTKLVAERERLRRLGEDKADWPRRLDTEMRKMSLLRNEEAARGLVDVRRRYDDRLKDPSKQDRESLPGELTADLTALAGRLNEEAANRLIQLVTEVLDDIDSASNLHESIKALTSDHLSDQLAGINMGTYSLNHYDRLSIISTFSSGRSLSTLVTGSGLGLTAGTLIAPPIGIAIGLGLGAFYAYQAYKGKNRAAFVGEFKAWMAEQCNQTQITINTTFQRELIDLQEEMRTVVRDALSEREAQINASLAESERLLATETGEREAQTRALRERRDRIRAVQQAVLAELDQLSAS